jgi:5-formyltetrahydrofolate cyclo-ligase
VTTDACDSKDDARLLGRAARRAVRAEDRPRRAGAAAERLLALPEIARSRTVLAYSATPEEIDPSPAVEALRARGVVTALPRVTGPGELVLHRVEPDTALVPGPFGLLEPPEVSPIVAPEEIDVAIVPGVAFDSACRRIGHGSGFYDRLNSLMGGAVTVGLAFDEQVLAEIPCEVHDVCVDILVTPSRTVRRREVR